RVTRGGEDIALSPTEYNLLRFLLQNKGRVVSKAQILDHVWNYDFGGDGGVVETYIGYLRRKLEAAGPRLIHTLRGVGYTLREPTCGVASCPPRPGPGGGGCRARRVGPGHPPLDARPPPRPGRRPAPGGHPARRGRPGPAGAGPPAE